MKTPLLLLGICTGLCINAQTIELADTLSTGDAMTYYVLDSNAVNLSAVTGPSVNWDYSAIWAYNTDVNTNTVIDADAAEFAAEFPDAAYSEDFENSLKTFFSNDPTEGEVIVHGFVFQEESSDFVISYTDPFVSYKLPMSQGDSYTDEISGTATVMDLPVAMDGEATVTADGSGTLVVGEVTYTNVIRVHTAELTEGMLLTQVVSIDRESYVYYDIDNFNMPVFIHATIAIDAGPGGEFGYTSVYTSGDVGFLNVEDNAELNLSVSVYPNPCTTDFTTVTTEEGTESLTIINSLGQVVKTINNPTISEEINVSDLSKGVYFVQAVKGNATKTEKFVIK